MPGAVLAGYEGRFDLAGWYLCRQVLSLRKSLPRQPPRVVDLGTGRGRDMIFLGRRGFDVHGVDLSAERLQKARRRAERYRLPLRLTRADLQSFRLRAPVEVVFSSAALNYLPRRARAAWFRHFRQRTVPGGVHAITVFLPPSGRAYPTDVDPEVVPFGEGELLGHYRDWELVEHEKIRIACSFAGAPHRHVFDAVIARRPGARPRAGR